MRNNSSMRLGSFYFLLFLICFLLSAVCAFTEEPLENGSATEQPPINGTNSPSKVLEQTIEVQPSAEQPVELSVESQGHENTGERKARQFGFPGFGYGPRPPFYGGGFGGGYGGGFGGGHGGGFGRGGYGGGGFQRTRVVTRTRVVDRVRGGGFRGGGFYG